MTSIDDNTARRPGRGSSRDSDDGGKVTEKDMVTAGSGTHESTHGADALGAFAGDPYTVDAQLSEDRRRRSLRDGVTVFSMLCGAAGLLAVGQYFGAPIWRSDGTGPSLLQRDYNNLSTAGDQPIQTVSVTPTPGITVMSISDDPDTVAGAGISWNPSCKETGCVVIVPGSLTEATTSRSRDGGGPSKTGESIGEPTGLHYA